MRPGGRGQIREDLMRIYAQAPSIGYLMPGHADVTNNNTGWDHTLNGGS